jgi:hypothetical protein
MVSTSHTVHILGYVPIVNIMQIIMNRGVAVKYFYVSVVLVAVTHSLV